VSNKINELNGATADSTATLRSARSPGAPTAGGAGSAAIKETAAAPSDVHITGTAAQLADLEQVLRQPLVLDSARIQALRTAIEQGQYTVQPDHIAAQLLQFEQALATLRAKSTGEPPASSDEP